MKNLANTLAAAMLICSACATAAADPQTTVTVNVTITVVPYAQVQLDQTTLNITITAGSATADSLYVGGTVVCNCPVMLFARVNPPAGAPGVWTTDMLVTRINTPGVFQFGELVRVIVWDIPLEYAGGSFDLDVSGHFAPTISQSPSPGIGEVMVTIVPQ